MAVWNKNDALLPPMRDADTGEYDTSNHTVKLQPVNQAYPTGAIDCEQLSVGYIWKPLSDLDTELHYWVYVDGSPKKKMLSFHSNPRIGG